MKIIEQVDNFSSTVKIILVPVNTYIIRILSYCWLEFHVLICNS